MSNQMFSPQENAPQGPEVVRPVNTDPREQSYEYQNSSQASGYSGASYMRGEKLNPTSTFSQRQWIWIIIAVVVVLVIGGSIINAISGLIFFVLGVAAIVYTFWRFVYNHAVPLPPQSFAVSELPTLVVHNHAGAIRVHRGAVNVVEIRPVRYTSSLFPVTSDAPVDYSQNGNRVEVRVWDKMRGGFSLGDIGRVDLEITVPEFTDLDLHNEAGSLFIEGINGHMVGKTNAGVINVQESTLSGQSLLSTNAGTVNVKNAVLRDSTRLETNAGTVDFSGSIQPGGHYHFETNAGTVSVALPSNSAFVLDAKTDLGSVNNQFGSTMVGESPRATLVLRTNMGTIDVRRL